MQTIDWNEQNRIVREMVNDLKDHMSPDVIVSSELVTVVEHDVDEKVLVKIVVQDVGCEPIEYSVGTYPLVEDGHELNLYNLWMLARDIATRVSQGLRAYLGVIR